MGRVDEGEAGEPEHTANVGLRIKWRVHIMLLKKNHYTIRNHIYRYRPYKTNRYIYTVNIIHCNKNPIKAILAFFTCKHEKHTLLCVRLTTKTRALCNCTTYVSVDYAEDIL
jgi:hypothetical protein